MVANQSDLVAQQTVLLQTTNLDLQTAAQYADQLTAFFASYSTIFAMFEPYFRYGKYFSILLVASSFAVLASSMTSSHDSRFSC